MLDALATYGGPILVFAAALLAIKGETWDQDNRRPTSVGYGAGLLAFIGLILSIINAHSDSKHQDNVETSLETALADLSKSRGELENASRLIAELREDVGDLGAQTRREFNIRSWERNPWKEDLPAGSRLLFSGANCDYYYFDGRQEPLRNPASVVIEEPPGEIAPIQVVLATFGVERRVPFPLQVSPVSDRCSLVLSVLLPSPSGLDF